MSKYLNNLVIGIDVASNFSFASILAPEGSQYKKAVKFFHTAVGFIYFLGQIKKRKKSFQQSLCSLWSPLACII